MTIDNRISMMVKAGDDTKAFDIKVLDVRGLSSVADYFVMFSGNSTRQVVGIGEAIEEKMSKSGEEPLSKEGYRKGEWVILDYDNILVHVFEKGVRDEYSLDKLWAGSKTIDIEELLT